MAYEKNREKENKHDDDERQMTENTLSFLGTAIRTLFCA